MSVPTKDLLAERTKALLQSLRHKLQWQDILTLFNQTIELIDIQPEHPRSGALPVLLVPGFSGNAEVIREHAHVLAGRGRRVLCVNAPHGVIADESWIGNAPDLPQTRKAIALVGTLERKNITRVDAVGYSEASITMTVAATLRPKMFRSLVLMNPAGLIAGDSLPRLMLSFVWDKLHETWSGGQSQTPERRRRLRSILREKTRSVFMAPLQSAREVHSISKTTIHEWLRSLQQEHDIKVALVQSPGDRVFPPAKTASFAEKAGIPTKNIYTNLQGMHDTVLANPEEAMEIADTVLDALARE